MLGLMSGLNASGTELSTHAVHGPALVAVQVAAAVCVGTYALNAYGRSSRSARRSMIQLAVLVALAGLGAAWVVQAGAGISIFAFSSVVFGRLPKVRRRLLVSAIAVLVFASLGASWVLFPFAALVAVRAMNLLGSGSGSTCSGRSGREHAKAPGWEGQCWQGWGGDGQGRMRYSEPVDLRKSASASDHMASPVPGQPDISAYVQHNAVPTAATALVREIDERSAAAAAYLAQQGRSSGTEAIEVERIRDDYAPEAVRAYLSLPPWSGDDTILADGKTGTQLLVGQLQLLAQRLRQIQDSVALTGGEQLRTHGAFLRDRFPTDRDDSLSL